MAARIGMGWLNVGSLALGLIAWALPLAAMVRRTKRNGVGRAAASAASLGCCAAALCLQLHYQSYLVDINDVAAVMDTIGAVALAARVLTVVTLALNALLLVLMHRAAKAPAR